MVAVLGTFSYPFKIIDPNISPFELDWTSNENVWIFCCSFWILVVLSLLNIKKLFQKNTDNPPNESAKIKQTIILVLITTTLLMVIQYFIKSRFEENYLLISISLNLLIVGALFFINKGSKFKFYLLCISLITSAISLIYINQKTNILVSQNQVESQNISVNNDKDSKELVGNIGVKTDSAASVTNTDVKDLFVFNNISELHSLFNYRDFNHAFVKKGDDYKISLFYVKEAGEDNSGNMYALKIEQQSEIVYVHIFEDNNNKLNILVEPNSGWTDKSQVQLFKTSNNSILIDYNILTNSQKYIKNKIEISYNEIKNKDNVTNSDGDIGDLIGTPIKISNLEVAQHDFPKEMNLEGAKKACSRLGDGWRLPTRDELNILYQNKDKIGGFAGYFYWSSAEISNGDECLQNFNNGRQTVNANEDFYCLIRAVRSF